jgi:P27 family predicted phage terminase small subunit
MATGRPNGRPPKPIEQKRALGNLGQRPLPNPPMPNEGLQGVKSIPTPPPLGADGLELWNLVWESGRSWLSPVADSTLVVWLCQAQDEAEEIRRSIALGHVPRFYQLPNGSLVSHPLVTQLKDLRVQMTGWLAALGFSPADRARLGVGEVRTADALDELQQRRVSRVAQVGGAR